MATVTADTRNVACCCFMFRNDAGQSFGEVQLNLRRDKEAWYNGGCCFALRYLLLLPLFVLMVLVFASTDCDLGPTRNAAGSLLLILFITEYTSILSYHTKWEGFCMKMNTFNTVLGIVVLALLMKVTVEALTRLPESCNQHSSRSLEVAAAASILAMLGVHVCLALNCKTNALWHRCSIAVSSSDESRPSQQQQEVQADMMDRRLLCLLCDKPEGGSTAARQVGLTLSLSWFQVLLSLLGWALLLAGCLLLNSNYASPSALVTAAGALTVTVAVSSLIGGWTAFLGETLIFRKENRVGKRRLAMAALGLSSWLLVMGLVTFCLLVAVAVVSAEERSRRGHFGAFADHAIRQSEGSAYFALVVLIILLLFALRNNAFLCRCHNFRCDYVCSCVMEEPRHDYDARSNSTPPPPPLPYNPTRTVPQQGQAPLPRTAASQNPQPQPRSQAALGATSAPQNSRTTAAPRQPVPTEVPRPQSQFPTPTAPPPSPPYPQSPRWRGRPEPPQQPSTPGRPDSPPPSYSEVVGYR